MVLYLGMRPPTLIWVTIFNIFNKKLKWNYSALGLAWKSKNNMIVTKYFPDPKVRDLMQNIYWTMKLVLPTLDYPLHSFVRGEKRTLERVLEVLKAFLLRQAKERKVCKIRRSKESELSLGVVVSGLHLFPPTQPLQGRMSINWRTATGVLRSSLWESDSVPGNLAWSRKQEKGGEGQKWKLTVSTNSGAMKHEYSLGLR